MNKEATSTPQNPAIRMTAKKHNAMASIRIEKLLCGQKIPTLVEEYFTSSAISGLREDNSKSIGLGKLQESLILANDTESNTKALLHNPLP